ncbi:flagellar hook-length control protein FliK [Alteromonas aestuariivivens]|uniref:Flagellar hook-length control protein FliK n=1 Tax=Alteromonas aestuariivivens TaxID=1938339 RepID=A0A3D8M5P7_9ALTE|nr:flagellar hook-length control protein FliK [Alteromonas aestuariivivens]RDV25073.1 flagellar hook-length control protein FliK [Alteromonas aestuariivivens]
MMQQVAAKSSEIAALPFETDSNAKGLSVDNAEGQFSDVFRQVSQNQPSSQPGVSNSKVSQNSEAAAQPVAQVSTAEENAKTAGAAPQSDDDNGAGDGEIVFNDAEPAEIHEDTAGQKIPADDLAEQAASEPDWLALVESIRSLADTEQALTGDPSARAEQMLQDADFLALVNDVQPLASDGTAAEIQTEVSDDTDSGKLAPETKVAALLVGLLQVAKQSEVAEESAGLLEAARQLLARQLEGAETGRAGQSELTATQTALVAQLSPESEVEPSPLSSQQQEDAELMLALMQAQLAGVSGAGAKEATSSGNRPLSIPQVSAVNVLDASKLDDISLTLQQLTEPARAQATEALADKIVAVLPVSVSEAQQSGVKGAVIAGVQEMQSQLAQGREPGVSLQDMIATALQQANIPADGTLAQAVEQQLGQFQSVLSNAQQASASAIQSLASADTVIQENSQLRSEISKAQAQREGLEKPVNIHNADGQQQLGDKIRWMVNSRNSMAEIRLDPPEMGSMQVRVNVSGDTASVSIVVQNAAAKEALADAVPRLRDMLAEQGIQLGESSVQQQNKESGEQAGEQQSGGASHGSLAADADEDTQVIEQRLSRQAQGGIDDYA